jgi:hypothetical protein
MDKINALLETRFKQIAVILLIAIFVNTCGSGDVKSINKRIDKITAKLDSCATKTDLIVEGLKTEKRMIQSTDRKLLDVNRQSIIDSEITKLESEKR